MSNKQPYRFKSIADFHRQRNLPPPEHPLISVIDFATMKRSAMCIEAESMVLDFYSISIKRNLNGKIHYGQQQYDFDEGVMFFIAPNQVFSIEPTGPPLPNIGGWILQVHPDFLWHTPLAKIIRQYDFFNYSVNEALFLSEKEEAVIERIIGNIQQEYLANIDKFSQNIIVSHLETLLNYSERFYERQFITRKISNHQILNRLEDLLNNYFKVDDFILKGLPSVQFVANELNVTPNYLSRLLKTLTGKSTQQIIHDKLIEKAKEKLSTTDLSVSEIAYELGFEHPQSFTKLFKSKTKVSPVAFRASFN